MDFRAQLTIADYVVIVIMFLVPLGIGVWFAYQDRKRATRDEYLLGGRRMALVPVTLSLFVTFQSAISLMGLPSDVYTYGPMFIAIYIGISLSYVVGYFIMIPVMYPLKLTSLYEYLFLRFESQTVRMLSTVIGMFQNLFYMAVALFSPALALQTAAGIPMWLSVVIVGVIGTVYTAVGGIKSVVWTDAFQTIIVFTGIFMVLIKGCLSVGSISDIWSIAEDGRRTSFKEISPDPRTRHTWWGMLIGGMFMWLANVFNQSTIQRVSSMRTQRDAGVCFLLNIPLSLIYAWSLFCVGIVMYAYFSYHQCDPIKGGLLTDINQIVPFYVLQVLRDLPGMPGMYMATLFSGGLSTISSGMNALAANTVEDLLKVPLRSVRESRVTLFTKAFVCFYGVIIIGLAYGASSLKGPVTQMSTSVFGACGGPVFGMFLMGIMIPWANKYGALAGGTVAIVFNVFLAITGQLYGRKAIKLPPVSIANCPAANSTTVSSNAFTGQPSASSMWTSSIDIVSTTEQQVVGNTPNDYGFFLFDISYEWYSVIGTVVCVFIGLTVSYLTRGLIKSTPKPELLSTLSRRWYSMPMSSDIELNKTNLEGHNNLAMSIEKIVGKDAPKNGNTK